VHHRPGETIETKPTQKTEERTTHNSTTAIFWWGQSRAWAEEEGNAVKNYSTVIEVVEGKSDSA